MKRGGRKRKAQPKKPEPEHNEKFWLRAKDPNWPLYLAIEAIDKRGDNGPLLKLLLDSKFELTPIARLCLHDLHTRYKLVSLPGGRRIPYFDVSPTDKRLLMAVDDVRYLTAEGEPRESAIEDIAPGYRISPDALRDAYHGKRGSLRRTRKRLALLKSVK
jgi:hypothetical protein